MYRDEGRALRPHTTLETSIGELQSTVQDLAKENEGLKDTLDGHENRQRRMNLRVLGIAEDSEHGQCPQKFMSELLVKVLNNESFTRPRPFILCFHRYQEREQVLQLAIQKRQLSYGGKKILIFPDLGARLVAKRSTYKKVKAQLHERDIKFSLRYNAGGVLQRVPTLVQHCWGCGGLV